MSCPSCLEIESHHYAFGTATITAGGGGPSVKLTSAQPSLLLLCVLMTALHVKNKVGRHRRRFDIRCALMILVERVGLASLSLPPSNCQSSPPKKQAQDNNFCTATQQTHIQGKVISAPSLDDGYQDWLSRNGGNGWFLDDTTLVCSTLDLVASTRTFHEGLLFVAADLVSSPLL